MSHQPDAAVRVTIRHRIVESLFYLGVALLCTHELDAMTHHEWRLLPGLDRLGDESGRVVFLLAHVPLFAVLIGFIASLNSRMRRVARLAVAGFLVVHAGLHQLYSRHELYTFDGAVSRGLILGAGLAGLLYWLLTLWRND